MRKILKAMTGAAAGLAVAVGMAVAVPAVFAADGEKKPIALPDDQPAAETPAPERAAAADMIGDGTRITVKEGDFSLVPPKGWEVHTHLGSLTLLMQIPHVDGTKYQRTIQVASFAGPRFIDEVTAKEYEEVIVRKFSAATTSIEGYRIRNHTTIEMTDGRSGLLFYTEFNLDGVPLMQAHILVSSKKRHYLMSYTDIATHFESDAASQFLTEAWDSMISVQLGSSTPSRYEAAIYIGIGFGVLLLLALLFTVVRRMSSGKEYREYSDSRDPTGDTSKQPRTVDDDGDGDGDDSNYGSASGRGRGGSSAPALTKRRTPPPGPPRAMAPVPVSAPQPKAKPNPLAALPPLPPHVQPPPVSEDEEPFGPEDDVAV